MFGKFAQTTLRLIGRQTLSRVASWTCQLEFARYERRLFHLCVALSILTLKIEAYFNLLPQIRAQSYQYLHDLPIPPIIRIYSEDSFCWRAISTATTYVRRSGSYI